MRYVFGMLCVSALVATRLLAATPTGRREYGVLFEPFDGRLIAMDGLR